MSLVTREKLSHRRVAPKSFPSTVQLAAAMALFATVACDASVSEADNGSTSVALEQVGVGPAALRRLPSATATLPACPTTGSGAIVAPGPCFVFTPAQAGASSVGANANMNQYALEPTGTARGVLVVHLNGSLGSPAGQIASPTINLYNALAADGFHVLGLAYRSTAIVGTLCKDVPSCFGPTRRSLVLGTVEPGAAALLNDMRADEGIVFRIDGALSLLAASRRLGRWGQFIDARGSSPTTRVRWNSLTASGHSQGGGHAAYLGSLFPLRRVVQLSSTCDAVGSTPAPWTAANGPWATPPATSFVGFSAATTFSVGGAPIAGDTTCPHHAAVWQNMGLGSSRKHDDATVCATAGAHGATIGCTANAARWAPLFE